MPCAQLHSMLAALPEFRAPDPVPFDKGLYIHFETGEICGHEGGSRIVKIGDHPHTTSGLKERLRKYYIPHKNSNVLRKYIGGALLRREDPQDRCLSPAPGKGHWEKQDGMKCYECEPLEIRVSDYIVSRTWFKCIRIDDPGERHEYEKHLIATVSLCSGCKASNGWLGAYAYSKRVRQWGLWQSHHVGKLELIMKGHHLDRLAQLVRNSVAPA